MAQYDDGLCLAFDVGKMVIGKTGDKKEYADFSSAGRWTEYRIGKRRILLVCTGTFLVFFHPGCRSGNGKRDFFTYTMASLVSGFGVRSSAFGDSDAEKGNGMQMEKGVFLFSDDRDGSLSDSLDWL